MIPELLKELENYVGSDDFEYDAEEIVERLEEAGAGEEILADLFGIMERHPLADFGMPGPLVHFIERFHPAHMPLLLRSLQSSPALQTLWMLNRCINAAEDRAPYLAVLKDIAENAQYADEIRSSAKDFYESQTNR